MKVGYHNAERLVRTELNYIENRAAFDAMKDADLEFYQFVATLDNRTTPICQSLDGQVFPLEEKSQGENAPPMHVRCRSTVIGSLDDGKSGKSSKGSRAAKDEDGKRIKIPADMNYSDWKKVYIDKTQTLADWRKNNLNNVATNGKMRMKTDEVERNDKIFMNIENQQPQLVGRLPNIEKATIDRFLEYFETQIASATIENGFVFTMEGDIYHCTGHLNGLPTIEYLGEKLKGAVVTHNHPVGSANEHSFSELDKTLFMDFHLSRLRGIDDKFVYEFNRNPNDIDGGEPTIEDLINGYGYRHWDVIRIARSLKIGYRRWRRE